MYEESANCRCGWCDAKTGRVIGVLVAVLLVVASLAGLLLVRNWYKSYSYIGVPETRDMVSVEGVGKITVIPDVATFNIGVQTEKPTVAEAQKENTTKMNAIIKALKDMGVKDEDIQTSQYNIYPQYDWADNRQALRGYQVNQDVMVKVRNLEKVGEVFAKAGELGANSVGGLQFTVDDPEAAKQEARVEAIKQAQAKAKFLADETGIKLGNIVSFYEYAPNEGPVYDTYSVKAEAIGLGGGIAPSIATGSSEVVVNVNVSYEVLR